MTVFNSVISYVRCKNKKNFQKLYIDRFNLSVPDVEYASHAENTFLICKRKRNYKRMKLKSYKAGIKSLSLWG